MKPEPPDSDWEKLVRCARSDTPPPIDRSALLRAVREAAIKPRAASVWLDELFAVFGSPRVVLVCTSLACFVAVLATWEIRDLDDSLPWAEMSSGLPGGEP